MRSRSRSSPPGAVVAGALLLAVALTHPRPGSAQEYRVDRGAENLVRFLSRAATEEFEGVTKRIDGYVLLDAAGLAPASGGEATEVYLEVDLGSLDTGIGLRDRHMRDRYLEVGKYPYATFAGKVTRREAGGADTVRVTAHGLLTIHGVARPRELTCAVVSNGAGYRARCAFEVLLSDHQIDIPKVMFLKLANEIGLELDFAVIPASPPNGDPR